MNFSLTFKFLISQLFLYFAVSFCVEKTKYFQGFLSDLFLEIKDGFYRNKTRIIKGWGFARLVRCTEWFTSLIGR